MKRSPLKRKTPLKARKPPVPVGPENKVCKCGTPYTRYVSTQNQCAGCLHLNTQAAKAKKKKSQSRAELIEYNENDKARVKRNAIANFNRWITHVRDVDKPCVSSGRSEAGWQWDAGHYIPAGRCEALRFDERNVHKQHGEQNRYQSANLTEYRIELIKRIGIDQVEELEGPQPIMNRTIEDYRAIRDEYRSRLKTEGIPRLYVP